MHLMVDIESMSVHESRALILSVAAVPFMPDTEDGPTIGGDAKLWVLDPRAQLALGRVCDISTQGWWADQSDAARDHWLNGVLTDLDTFCREFAEVCDGCADGIWANGACFDLCNLVQLIEDAGHARPWKYNVARDARTIYQVSPRRRSSTVPADLVAHDPRSDCIMQIHRLWGHWPSPVASIPIAPTSGASLAA